LTSTMFIDSIFLTDVFATEAERAQIVARGSKIVMVRSMVGVETLNVLQDVLMWM